MLQDLEELADMLDEKDEEIQKQRGLVEKLKKKMLEQEEQNSTIRRDYENLDKEKDEIKAENEYAREKVKEAVMFYSVAEVKN